ncbi:MAG: hypothetical protein JWN17_3224 [Frankiales bacterium]|nr:hypothetical protein [Frankiales bacterium]
MRPSRPLLVLAALVAALLASVPALGATAAPPGLVRSGTTSDGWVRYALADGALPGPALPGVELRAEVHFPLAGRDRAVRLLVPASAPRPAPLLLALHGLYQTVAVADRDQGWGAQARRSGFVLAYGVGTSASWDAGTCCGDAVEQGVDDVAYLDRVVEVARALHPLDPRRLDVTGFSNGAMMAYRYACERPAAVAAVLAVSGTVVADCPGRVDVAVLAVHGLDDRTVPLAGRAYDPALHSPLPPVSHTTAFFGPRISAVLLPRFGHGWPDAVHGRYATTARGWAFLQAHPQP